MMRPVSMPDMCIKKKSEIRHNETNISYDILLLTLYLQNFADTLELYRHNMLPVVQDNIST